MDWLKDLGNQVRKARENIGLSQDALARSLSISRARISQIEAGRSKPTVNIVTGIAAALRTDLFVAGYRVSGTLESESTGRPIGMPKQLIIDFDTEYRVQASTADAVTNQDQAITLKILLRRDVA